MNPTRILTRPILNSLVEGFYNKIYVTLYTITCLKKISIRFFILSFLFSNISLATAIDIQQKRLTQSEQISINGSLRQGVLSKSLEKTNLALSLDAQVNTTDTSNNTALLIAVKKNIIPIAKVLLKHKASCTEQNTDGETPLFVAAKKGYTEMVYLLLKKSNDMSDVEKVTNDKKNPLHIAAERGHLEIVKALLNFRKGNINIDSQDDEGFTALILAAQKNKEDIVKLLIKAGANPLVKDEIFKKTALYFAGKNRNLHNIKILAKATLRWKPKSIIAPKALKFVKALSSLRQKRFSEAF